MVTEVSTQGWFSRIIESIKGILVGSILVLVCVVALFWNEGRSVTTAKTIGEVGESVVNASIDAIDPAMEGKPVYVTGTATSTETLKDDLGVAAPNAIALARKVEMYQWKEEKSTKKRSNVGGSETTETTYTYDKSWEDEPVASASFKERGHDNPATMPFQSTRIAASVVTIGVRRLSPDLVKEISANEPFPVDAITPASTGGKPVKPSAGGWYFGADPATPQIGDVRVQYLVARPQPVSIISGQQGPTFTPWIAPSTKQEFARLDPGTLTAQAMVATAQAENSTMTWIIRLIGFVVMVMGFAMVFRPLVVVADVLPLFGSIASLGTGAAAFGLGAIVSFLTIGIAWIFYRPLIGVSLVVLGIGILVMLFVKGSGAKKARAAA
jgi:hypothetical protein